MKRVTSLASKDVATSEIKDDLSLPDPVGQL